MIRSLISTSILLSVVLSCSRPLENETTSDTKQGGILHLNVPENIYSLFPDKISNESELFIARQIYETIILANGDEFDLNRNIVSSIEHVSIDTLLYQFNSEIRFSNGIKIDSTSVHEWVKSLNINGISSYFEPEKNSLIVINSSLESANSTLSQTSNYLFGIDESIPIGTGPFRLRAINEDISVDLIRNSYYPNQSLPYLNAIEIRMVKTKDTEVDEFIKGSLDLIKLDPLQRLQYSNVLSLDNHSNFQLNELDQKSYCFGLVSNLDSLEAYQIAKTLNARPHIFDIVGQPRILHFPNLSQARIRESVRIDSDNSVFSQLTLEQLSEVGVTLNAGASPEADDKYMYLLQGKLDSRGNPVFVQPDISPKSFEYLIILNSWTGLAVYQYYVKSEDQIDRGMIDLKSVYFEEPKKLE